MICPVCYNKMPKENAICYFCGFKTSELKTASNKEVKSARKNGLYDDIIYTAEFPTDLNYKKTFYMTVLGGWFGLHNFYVNKTFKGIFNIVSLILSLVSSLLVSSGTLGQEFMSITIYTSILFVATLIMWILDIVALLTKSFKVPVVLKKSNKKEIKNDKQ